MLIEKRLKEIKSEKLEIRKKLEANEEMDLEATETKLAELDAEERRLISKQEIAKRINAGEESVEEIKKEDVKEERKMDTREDLLKNDVYRRAFVKKMQGKELDEIEQRAYTSASDSGGAVIPTPVADEIISKIKQTAPMLEKITLLRVKGNVTFAVEGTRNVAGLHTENEAITGATDTLVKVTLGGYEVTKLVQISKTVATMSINAFESWLTEMLAEDIARKIEDLIINGTGSSQPTGIALAGSGTAGAYVADTDLIEVAAATNVAYSHITSLIGLLNGAYDRNASFLMSKKTLYGIFMPLKDDGKYPLVVREGNNYTIMGYPVTLSEYVDSNVAYLGDFKKVVGNLAEDITVASSAHSSFGANAIDYLGCAIFDCKPAFAGAIVKFEKKTE